MRAITEAADPGAAAAAAARPAGAGADRWAPVAASASARASARATRPPRGRRAQATRPPPGRRPDRGAGEAPPPAESACAAATPAAARATTRSARTSCRSRPASARAIVTFAAIVAFVFAVANVATALTGNDISSATGDPSVATAVTTALLLVAGFGMLARQYWAVLGFETILGLQIVFFSLYLIGVQTWWHAIIPIVAIGLLGWLFWKLISAMARLQMPKRP